MKSPGGPLETLGLARLGQVEPGWARQRMLQGHAKPRQPTPGHARPGQVLLGFAQNIVKTIDL